MSMDQILRSKIGGFKDTLALSSIGAGGLLTSPFFSSVPATLPLAMGAVSMRRGGLLQAIIAIPQLRREAPRLRANSRTVA
ncbi:hypothetical protein CVV67_21085, partial [Arthrobacter stackebrandtii]